MKMDKLARNLIGVLAIAAWLAGCATGGDGGGGGGDDGGGGGGSRRGGSANPPDDDVYVSGDLTTLGYSLSNNPQTSRTVDRRKAGESARDLQGSLKRPDFKDRKDLVALMALKRLAGADLGDVVRVANLLVDIEMKKDIGRDLPEVAKLEIVLAAINSRKLSMADHFLNSLVLSKNVKVKAAAFTAEGIIAMLEGRLPEAVDSWNKAIKISANYEPALINLGVTAAKYGDYKTAKRVLSSMQDDWYVVSALIVAERVGGNPVRAEALCKKLLSQKSDYKPGLYSCALNDYQGLGKPDLALQKLKRLVSIRSGSTSIDERAYKTIATIEKDMRESKQKAQAAKKRAAPKRGEGKGGDGKGGEGKGGDGKRGGGGGKPPSERGGAKRGGG